MKKLLTLLTALSLLFSSNAAYAFANEEVLITPENLVVEEAEALDKNELNRIFENLADKFNQQEKVPSDYMKASQLITNYSRIMEYTEGISTTSIFATSTYDENKAKLRQGNYIETILDLDEGITTTQLTTVAVLHANTAKSAAASTYPNDSSKEDAFRHYAWNFISTKDTTIGKIKTRTITINHEWGLVLLTPVLNYYDSQYKKYITEGYSANTASNKAFADATLWIPDLKYQLVLLCQNSLSTFKGLFTVGNIMDLYNNCYGRSGPESHPNKTYSQAFFLDYSSLILSESSVTNYYYNYVWQNEWYTY